MSTASEPHVSEHPPPSAPNVGNSRRRLDVACALVFLVTAIVVVWPLPMRMADSLPLGTEEVPTVPLLNLWTVWWNADRAAAGFSDYWNAPIFQPADWTFAFSEAQPTTLAVAPFVWLQGHAIVAYNVYLLASLFLNGLAGYGLLRSQRFGRWPALVGGVLMQTLPFVFWQLGVLQLTLVWPVLWTIRLGLNLMESPRWRTALHLGLAFGVTYAACNYYGLFLSVLFPPAAIVYFHRHWVRPASWLKLVTAAGTAGLLISPIVVPQRTASAQYGWTRDAITVKRLSAHTRDYTDTPSSQWLDAWEDASPRHNRWSLGPGLLKLAGAAVGIVWGLARRDRRRWTVFAAAFGLLAWILSLGPQTIWGMIGPYQLLRDFVPGFAQIRSPFRFALFVQVAVAWLCTVVVDGATPRNWSRGAWSYRHGVRCLVACGLPALFLLETQPAQSALHKVPQTSPLPSWVTFVRNAVPADSVLLCLPMATGRGVDDYENEAVWMYWGMFHRRRLVNGYSGYFPSVYLVAKEAFRTIRAPGTKQFAAYRADYAVVRQSWATPQEIRALPSPTEWHLVFRDEAGGVDVYHIAPAEPATTGSAGETGPN